MRFCLFVAAAAVSRASISAHANTLTQTLQQVYQNVQSTEEDTGGIALFNPDLGTLVSVTQTLSGQIVFIPSSASASYVFNVNGQSTPIRSLITETSGGFIDVSVTSGPTLEESSGQFGQQYEIEPFDLEVNNGSVSSIGIITDTFNFNYVPAAVTPEPSSLCFLGTAVLGMLNVIRKRSI